MLIMRIIIINLSSDFSMTYRRLTEDIYKHFTIFFIKASINVCF